jgi:hypothetical protein
VVAAVVVAVLLFHLKVETAAAAVQALAVVVAASVVTMEAAALVFSCFRALGSKSPTPPLALAPVGQEAWVGRVALVVPEDVAAAGAMVLVGIHAVVWLDLVMAAMVAEAVMEGPEVGARQAMVVPPMG